MTLWNEFKQKNEKVFFQFSGNIGNCLRELKKLYAFKELKDHFNFIFSIIDTELETQIVKKSAAYRLGFNLKKWLENENVDEIYLQEAMITIPITFITQIMYYQLLILTSLKQQSELIDLTYALSGYSQGIVSAVFISLNLKGDDYWAGLKNHFAIAFYTGFAISSSGLKLYQKPTFQGTPMININGISYDELTKLLSDFNQEADLSDTVVLSIICTDSMFVVSGKIQPLAAFTHKIQNLIDNNLIAVKTLPFLEPYHHPMLSQGSEIYDECLNYFSYPYRGSDLFLPVYSPIDGSNLQNHDYYLGKYLGRLIIDVQLDWLKCVTQLKLTNELGAIIDLGPGIASSVFTRKILSESDINIYSMSREKHVKKLVAIG